MVLKLTSGILYRNVYVWRLSYLHRVREILAKYFLSIMFGIIACSVFYFCFYAVFAWFWEWVTTNDLKVTYMCYCILFALLGRIYCITVYIPCTSAIVNLWPLSCECVCYLSTVDWDLHGLEKRRDAFNFLKQKQKSIYFLQDIHFTKDDVNIFRSMWGFEIFISQGRTYSRGVAISFINNFRYEMLHPASDEIGKKLAIWFTIESHK